MKPILNKIFSSKKIIILFTFFVLASFLGKTVFAVWNNTFYNPGDTLNPECLPTDIDCDVRSPLTSTNISDIAYDATTWDGVIDIAPSKNAIRDKIESLITGSHNPVTIGVVTNGLSLSTQVLSLALASATTTGALSDTDWNTFNNKQPAGTYSTDIHSNITALNAVSGTNTGDNAVNILYSGLVSSQWSTSGSNISYSTGNVGIGTTSPINKLDIYGASVGVGLNTSSATGYGPAIYFQRQGATKWYQQVDSLNEGTNQLDFDNASGINVLSLLQSGNVGIGTTSPSYKLDVSGDVNISSGSHFKINGVDLSYSDIGANSGSGTTNYIPKYTGANTFGNSSLSDDGVSVKSALPFVTSGGSYANPGLTSSLTSLYLGTSAGTQIAFFNTGSVYLYRGLRYGGSGGAEINAPAADTMQLGSPSANNTAVVQTLKVQDNITGTNLNAPASFTIKAPAGTGTGTGGSIVFQAPVSGTTGTTAHTQNTILTLQDSGTAGTSKPQAVFAIGTAALPSITFDTDTTTGIYRTAAGQVAISSSGSGIHTFAATYYQMGGANPAIYLGIAPNYTSIRYGGIGITQLGDNAATPTAQFLQAAGSRGGTDTDASGANLTIRSGAGTGAATGSSLIFQTPLATTTGTTAQTQTERMRITGAGNVGIGTTAPAYPLEVASNATASGGRWSSTSTAQQWIEQQFRTGIYNNSTTRSNAMWAFGLYQTGTASNVNDNFYIGRSGLANDFVINRDGNVGIGTTNPASKLVVLGTNTDIANSSTSQNLYISGTADGSNVSTLTWRYYGQDKGWYQSFRSTTDQLDTSYYSGSTWTAGISQLKNGNVGIGTTNPTELLQVGIDNEVATSRKVLRFGTGGYAAPGAFSTNSNGDKLIFYNGADFDGRFGASSGGEIWLKALSTRTENAGLGSLSFYTGQGAAVTPKLRLQLGATGNVAIGGLITSATDYTGASMVINSGNVGIGTTAPSDKLTIYGGSETIDGGSGAGALTIKGTGDTNQYSNFILSNNSDTHLWAVSNRKLAANAHAFLFFNYNGSTYNNVLNLKENGDINLGGNFNETTGAGAVLNIVAGNVGIGKTDPKAMLNVGSTTINYGSIQLGTDGGTNNNTLTHETDGSFGIWKGTNGSGTRLFTILGGGNVGIGISNPLAKFDVGGSAKTLLRVVSTATGNTGTIEFNNGSNYNYGIVGNVGGNGTASGDVFGLGYSSNNNSTFTSVLNWTSGDNVGIGTTAPGAALHVAGPGGQYVKLFNTGYILTAGPSGTHQAYLGADTSAVYVGSYSNSNLNFITNNVNRISVDMSGNVGIGTTAPASKLDILDTTLAGSGSLNGSILNLAQTWNTTGVPTAIKLNVTNTASGTSPLLMNLLLDGASKFAVSWKGELNIASDATIRGRIIQTSSHVGGLIGSSFTPTMGQVGTGEQVVATSYTPIYNQPSATSVKNTDFLINRTETSLGTTPGAQNLIDAGTGGGTFVSKFNVSNTGAGYFAGNVGIGTTSPSHSLTIGGTTSSIQVGDAFSYSPSKADFVVGSNNSNSRFLFGQSNTIYGGMQWNYNATAANAFLSVGTMNGTNTLGLNILQNGNVGIGTTAPGYGLEVAGSAFVGNSFYVQSVSGAYSDLSLSNYEGNSEISITSTEITHTSAKHIFNVGNVGIGTTAPGYTLTVAGTAWVTSGAWSGSDARWKQNIQPIASSDALNKVMQLSGVTYNWNQLDFPQNNFDSLTHLGFIAQEVEKIVPDLVTTGADGYKGVDYNGFAPLVIEAIKELNLNFEGISGTITPLAGSANETFVSVFFDNVKIKVGAWLADTANGIGDVFGGTFHAKDKLCINNTCVTEAQLQTLIQNSANVGGAGTSLPEPTPAPGPAPVPTCTAPQTLVDNVCTDPAPVDPPPVVDVPTCTAPQTLVDNVCTDPVVTPDPTSVVDPASTP